MKIIHNMLKRVCALVLVALFVFTQTSIAFADTTYANWNEVAAAMEEHIQNGVDLYAAGGENAAKEGKDAINIAYYKFYEKLGYEKTVMAYISGARGAEVENQFYETKKSMTNGESVEVVQAEADILIQMLHEDADILDGVSSSDDETKETQAEGETLSAEEIAAHEAEVAKAAETMKAAQDFTTFLTSFGLTLREGVEAILVVAAIIAYLIKTDSKKYVKGVYVGAILGIVFSVVLAIGFNMLAKSVGEAESGASQEIFEGVAMFVACAVLFYVSNWMLSKSEVEVWNKYIQSQVEKSITKGNYYTLAFTSFIAVSREGAELILFFQGMRSNIANSPYHMWLGLGIATVVLVVIYILIAKLSIRLPLKPFFMFTSCLMFLLCISFVGKGVYELQEADVIGRTIIPWMNGFTFELLGIYDRLETIIPQIILLIVTIVSVIYHLNNNKKIRTALEKKSQQ